MSGMSIEDQMERDVRQAPARIVLYLEGKTDVDLLFALLGRETPASGLSNEGVLVQGLSKGGSGSSAVRTRIEVASRKQTKGIFGVVDGDGAPLDELARDFDPPDRRHLSRWKAYCIENLLVKTGWPANWGNEPDWKLELARYAPYVAVNRIHKEILAILEQLGVARFSFPDLSGPLRPADEFASVLIAGADRFRDYGLIARFEAELASFLATLDRSMGEGHAFLNGKFLLDDMAPRLTGRPRAVCKFEWLAHSRSVGGLPEVREWWGRLTGSPP